MIKKYSVYLLLGGLVFIASPLQADAPLDDELTQAMNLEPNIEDGKQIFKLCMACHQATGWGLEDGSYPQLSSQHRSVIIKQVADIRAGNRDNPEMYPISKEAVMGGPQAISDVAAYLASLPMDPEPGTGRGINLERAEKLYYRKCAECHGSDGSGDAERYFPRIHGQHYEYLLRQIKWIRNGKRRNANPVMAKRVAKMKMEDLDLLADYVSRMKPPAELLAEPGWKNPDFE
ncbi:MAG: c-type cytochrome [Pseudomonadota bacterium]